MMATSWARCAQAAKRAGRVSWALKMLKLEALQLSITARIARRYNPQPLAISGSHQEVADSKIGDSHRRGISGGERRRVAIGKDDVLSARVSPFHCSGLQGLSW